MWNRLERCCCSAGEGSPDHAEAEALQIDVQVHDAAALHMPHPLQPQVHLRATAHAQSGRKVPAFLVPQKCSGRQDPNDKRATLTDHCRAWRELSAKQSLCGHLTECLCLEASGQQIVTYSMHTREKDRVPAARGRQQPSQ